MTLEPECVDHDQRPVFGRGGSRIGIAYPADFMHEKALRPSPGRVTNLLMAWRGGDQGALNELMPLVYEELRRLARLRMRGERPGHQLQTTALVNEAYLRLIDLQQVRWQDRAHFFAMSARMMRRILVDFARSRQSRKRGGEQERVRFDEALTISIERGPDLVALDDALGALAVIDRRKSQIVELRFFGGLTVDETAEALDVSRETVIRDWNVAKVWLLRQMDERRDEG